MEEGTRKKSTWKARKLLKKESVDLHLCLIGYVTWSSLDARKFRKCSILAESLQEQMFMLVRK